MLGVLINFDELSAAAQIAYPNKFTTFLTKLIKYLHNLIEIYMYIAYQLGQRQRQTPVGVLELRSCGTSQRIQYYFKVNLVIFFTFLILSLYFSHKVDVCKYNNTKYDNRTPINKEVID